ncbi:MAG: tRNA uridine-5-carboxymethylaminomethyl(34) synthesis GTPase MnmE [Opitutaceae bacterium]|nr:tRNA uridine-5-carboxymethylaminomethyl(34) synthesis GTPase MnmE [Opitutaceae bacterium]
MTTFTDTIAALATPIGASAIAVVRASGPACAKLAAAALRTGAADAGARLPSPPPPRLAIHADYQDRSGAVLDDVLATYFAAPHSYTGDDSLEISCHGNPFIAQKILEDLLARGCRAAGPGEFTRRAFLNGRIDLSQAEAVMDLIHARGERALAAANQQLRGSLGRHVAALTGELLQALARVEAYIDFPDEDLPAEDRTLVRRALATLTQGTDRLLATRRYGEILREGIKTVLLGEPNAGKSSLLNRLVGRDRALVSPEPGTTRDFIEERLILGPHCLRLIDTAGLNPSPAPLEKLGMDKTLERAAEADLLILVLDATRPAPVLPQEIMKRLTPENTVVALNKCDLRPAPAPADAGSGKRQVIPPPNEIEPCDGTASVPSVTGEIGRHGSRPSTRTGAAQVPNEFGKNITSTKNENPNEPTPNPQKNLNTHPINDLQTDITRPASASPPLPHPSASHLSTFPLSALTGEGIPALTEAIIARAEAFRLDQGGDLIAINARHADALARARNSLADAVANLDAAGPEELLSSDLRAALDALGEIAGRIDNERMLDHLFATFCIGK